MAERAGAGGRRYKTLNDWLTGVLCNSIQFTYLDYYSALVAEDGGMKEGAGSMGCIRMRRGMRFGAAGAGGHR